MYCSYCSLNYLVLEHHLKKVDQNKKQRDNQIAQIAEYAVYSLDTGRKLRQSVQEWAK